METTRQQKIARQIQRDMSDILMREAAPLIAGAMVSVTAVRVSPDFALARIYLSIFPFEKKDVVMSALNDGYRMIRKALGMRIRNQLRIVPELVFELDDSLEYIAHIDELLK